MTLHKSIQWAHLIDTAASTTLTPTWTSSSIRDHWITIRESSSQLINLLIKWITSWHLLSVIWWKKGKLPRQNLQNLWIKLNRQEMRDQEANHHLNHPGKRRMRLNRWSKESYVSTKSVQREACRDILKQLSTSLEESFSNLKMETWCSQEVRTRKFFL